MNKTKFRTDHKKNQLIYEVIFLLLTIVMFAVNVWNTKKVSNMYILAGIMLAAIIIYTITYIIFVHKNKNDLFTDEKSAAFYVSVNIHNKKLKKVVALLDTLSLLGIISIGLYYFFKMDFINVYPEYLISIIAFVAIIELIILIKDIAKISSIDRLDALTNKHTFSILDKKLIFALILLIVCALNVGILSFKKPHFIVYFKDLVIFEIIALATLIFTLLSITVTRIYYSKFSLKQLEQKIFDTQFLEEIGKGSYATIYKAYLPSLDSVYAIKKLDSTDVKDIERFEQEYKILKSLSHPNIIGVYTYDEVKYEYIMDYMPNTLYDYVSNNIIPDSKKLNLIKQLLDGMEYLHSHKILHRDISYKNIMIKESESFKDEISLKILDFGISKNKRINKMMTKTHVHILGTLCDPTLEDFKNYNEQNDIYLIGLMINFIYHQSEAIKSGDTPMNKIVHKCLNVDLNNRYKSVLEIKNDIKQVEVR